MASPTNNPRHLNVCVRAAEYRGGYTLSSPPNNPRHRSECVLACGRVQRGVHAECGCTLNVCLQAHLMYTCVWQSTLNVCLRVAEYRGEYTLSVEELKDFHRPRVLALASVFIRDNLF